MLPTAIRMAMIAAPRLIAGRVARVGEAHRLEHAPDAVVQVHAQQDHRDDVERRDGVVLEAVDHVGAHVGVIGGELGGGQSGDRADGQVQDVEDHEGAR